MNVCVDVISDVICPWCYIGKAKLDRHQFYLCPRRTVMSEKKKRSLADELRQYGERSVDGLARMGNSLSELLAQVPKPVDEAAYMVAGLMPGAATLESIRLGGDSGRLWREGNYGDSIIRMGEAIDAPFDDVFWLIPGGGLVRKVAK